MHENAFASMIKRRPQLWYYVILNCAVAVCFLGINAFILLSGGELVWAMDAQPLYVNFLTWGVQAFREMVDTFMAGGGLQLPQYTYTMGYGVDVPMTFGSYLQDPLNLIALAFPLDQMSVAYGIMILVRMMFAASAFSVFCFGRFNGRKATGVAALAYATCGFIVFWGVLRHPKFIDWAIILPLVFRGVDKVFDRESPALFMVAWFLQLFTSTYYSYMTGLLMLVYCLVKYFFEPRMRSAGDFVALVGKFVALLAVAFAASAVFWLPQVFALLSQSRATSGAVVPALFTIKYYAKVAVQLTGANVTTNGLVLGAVPTFGLLVFALCGKRYNQRERKPWLVGAVLLAIGVLVPFVGHVLNGMGYVTDRWMGIVGFVSSYILCLTVPVLPKLDARDWRRVFVGAAVVAVIGVVFGIGQIATADGAVGMIWPLTMTCAFAAIVFAAKRLSQSASAPAFLGAAVMACIIATSTFYCSPIGENWGSLFADRGSTGEKVVKLGPAAAVESLGDEGVYRYSQPYVYNIKNSSLTHDALGIDFYSSYYNQRVDNFRQELGMSDHPSNFSFVGSGARLAVDSLVGAKYFVAREESEWLVPYGFEKMGDWGNYGLYENKTPVPMAFGATSVIPRSVYESLSMVEKQEALLQGVVVDETALDAAMPTANLNLATSDIPYEVVKTKNLTIEGNTVKTTKKNASMTLRFTGLPNSETYFCLTNLDFAEYSKAQIAEASGEEQTLQDGVDDALSGEEKTFPIDASIGKNGKTFTPTSKTHVRYGGKVDWAVCLGYRAEPVTEMKVKFSVPGEYTFDKLSVVCQPVEPIVNSARDIASRGLSDLRLSTNSMSAKMTLADDKPEIAVFTVAYTPGWTVTVDGEPARALNVDTAFCGVEVQGAGEHVIEWNYTTPGVNGGSAASLIGIAAFVLILVVRRFTPQCRRRG